MGLPNQCVEGFEVRFRASHTHWTFRWEITLGIAQRNKDFVARACEEEEGGSDATYNKKENSIPKRLSNQSNAN